MLKIGHNFVSTAAVTVYESHRPRPALRPLSLFLAASYAIVILIQFPFFANHFTLFSPTNQPTNSQPMHQ